jgi:5-methylcytosine-specific restriction endonuclease McrA
MPKSYVPAKLRRLVIARARGRCEYCHSPVSHAVSSFAIEHIIPREKGGRTTADNLALSCQGCNNHKHIKTEAIDPLTKQLAPLFHPRQQAWREHFAWNEDCSLAVGQTPTGRATIAALRLNRPGVVNLRQLLYAAGQHPPAESSS